LPSAGHAELVSASGCLLPVMPNLFRHLTETPKRVQGDDQERMTLKQVQGDMLRRISPPVMPSIKKCSDDKKAFGYCEKVLYVSTAVEHDDE
jgi:hypothetical protein